jgi:hypothetical protein
MARAPDFDLAKELRKPSFTPAARDAPALVELAAGGDERAAAALGRLGDAASSAIAARLDALDEAARARLIAPLGKLGAHDAVIARLADPSPRVRRAAVTALGKLGAEPARAALLAYEPVDPSERRALAEALGKVGGDAALARLRGLDPQGDAELARRRDRAALMIERDARRDDASAIALDVPPPAPVVVRLHCRAGLASLLADELAARALPAARAIDDGAVELALDRPWSALFASRLWAGAGVRLPLASHTPDDIVAALLAARPLLRAWTRGAIRWRLGFARGHKRAIVWRVAQLVAAAAPELLNDPTATTWDVLVDDDGPALELVPRKAPLPALRGQPKNSIGGFDDPRFAYRVADVPAASHPSVAAALAFVARARETDRVWDPFCGSAVELVERARLGAFAALHGSDVSDDALAAARANLDAAGVVATLARADARDAAAPWPIDLVVTNPPLGSRLRGDAPALLVAALPNLARQLAPDGRLVWITPAPAKTGAVAERLGLRRTTSLAVDLGGVRGQLERWDRASS